MLKLRISCEAEGCEAKALVGDEMINAATAPTGAWELVAAVPEGWTLHGDVRCPEHPVEGGAETISELGDLAGYGGSESGKAHVVPQLAI